MIAWGQGDLRPLGLDLRVDVEDGDAFFSAFQDPASHLPLSLLESSLSYPSGSAAVPSNLSSGSLYPQCVGCNLSLLGASPEYLRKYGYGVTEVPNIDDRVDRCKVLAFRAAVDCWASLDQYVMEKVVPAVPLLSVTWVTGVSARVRSFAIDVANGDSPFSGLSDVALTPEAIGSPPSVAPAPSTTPTDVPAIPGRRGDLTPPARYAGAPASLAGASA